MKRVCPKSNHNVEIRPVVGNKVACNPIGYIVAVDSSYNQVTTLLPTRRDLFILCI
jgi:hypothetical protein